MCVIFFPVYRSPPSWVFIEFVALIFFFCGLQIANEKKKSFL